MSSKSIASLVSDPEILLALEPEELAGLVLNCLQPQGSDPTNRSEKKVNRNNFIHQETVQGYPREYQQAILNALSEAWSWLEHEGLIAQRSGESEGWVFITRRGQRIKSATDFQTFRQAKLLPRDLLHAHIAEKIWPLFIRGEYDTAVFQAFKEVEVAVRTAGRFATTDLGVKLMRNAFDPQNGPLTDKTSAESERQALSDLFAGAIGSYKNPGSHRHVSIDAPEAVEMIILASHLLKIVDSRKQ
jgi:uncharacterized protein (TIGR02391 family)